MSDQDNKPEKIRIEHPFEGTLIIALAGSEARLWLNRDEAMELCEKLPSAIAQMPVKI